MKTENQKKQSKNPKTKLVDVSGNNKKKRAPKIDKIFSQKKLKQREYQDRQNKGYIRKEFCGDEEGLILYLNKCVYHKNIGNPLKVDIKTSITEVLKNYKMDKVWSMDRLDFRLYYIPQNWKKKSKKLFKLYLVESKFQEVEAIMKKIRALKPLTIPSSYHPV
ncbi:hypothetical protein BH10BAC1_BH10BAC1_11590 [soil metagenome]